MFIDCKSEITVYAPCTSQKKNCKAVTSRASCPICNKQALEAIRKIQDIEAKGMLLPTLPRNVFEIQQLLWDTIKTFKNNIHKSLICICANPLKIGLVPVLPNNVFFFFLDKQPFN